MAWVKPSKNNQDHLVTGGDDGAVVIWTRVLDPKSDLHKVAVRKGTLFVEFWSSSLGLSVCLSVSRSLCAQMLLCLVLR